MRNPSATPLTKAEIKLALCKSSPSSAPGPDGVPYSVWKKVNLINPAILLKLRTSLVAFQYHPPLIENRQRGGLGLTWEGLVRLPLLLLQHRPPQNHLKNR